MGSLNGTIEDEVTVLRLCLDTLGIGAEQVVPSMTMSWMPGASYLQKHMPDLSGTTLFDFDAKNKEKHPVEPHFTLDGQLHCVPMEELERLLDAPGSGSWKQFRELYPQSHGIVSFSRVGLDVNVTQALVLIDKRADVLMDFGQYWLCVKTKQGWVVSQQTVAWFS